MRSSLADFIFIGAEVLLYTPLKAMLGQSIPLCTWLGTVHRHTEEYTVWYRRITSNARILLHKSSFGILISVFFLEQ